jgi:signal transduction histidine kinase
MRELRQPALRLALGLALAAALLVEVRTLIQSLHAHQRLQARAGERLRQDLGAARARVSERLQPGGEQARAAAAAEAAEALPGAAIEIFDPTGRRLLALGQPPPIAHWVDVGALAASGPLGVYVVGPFQHDRPYLLAYALLPAGAGREVLRVALPVDDLSADIEERRELLLTHAASLALVVIVALVLLLAPRREGAEPPPAARALLAYEAAMEHLREREERLSQEHAAERQRLEQVLREQEALARAGELTTGMAHEMRNGLGTIVGYARLLERAGLSPDDQAAVAAIRAECEALESIVRRFVDYVRRDELKAERFDLRRSLERVLARETRSRGGAAVELLPGPAFELWGDEELIEHAVENVLRNGREAAGERGRVEIELRAAEAWAEISVRDDGPGLGPEGVAALRPFRSTKPGGLGLGLPLAAKVVRLHGGELRLGERVPHGLEVLLRLPRGAAEAPRAATPGNDSPRASPEDRIDE